MPKLLILFFFSLFLILQTLPAYCVTRTMSFHISVTIPEHVMVPSNMSAVSVPQNQQLVQTQLVMRNNKPVQLTSIVVP